MLSRSNISLVDLKPLSKPQWILQGIWMIHHRVYVCSGAWQFLERKIKVCALLKMQTHGGLWQRTLGPKKSAVPWDGTTDPLFSVKFRFAHYWRLWSNLVASKKTAVPRDCTNGYLLLNFGLPLTKCSERWVFHPRSWEVLLPESQLD